MKQEFLKLIYSVNEKEFIEKSYKLLGVYELKPKEKSQVLSIMTGEHFSPTLVSSLKKIDKQSVEFNVFERLIKALKNKHGNIEFNDTPKEKIARLIYEGQFEQAMSMLYKQPSHKLTAAEKIANKSLLFDKEYKGIRLQNASAITEAIFYLTGKTISSQSIMNVFGGKVKRPRAKLILSILKLADAVL